jgi:hypothetical protein
LDFKFCNFCKIEHPKTSEYWAPESGKLTHWKCRIKARDYTKKWVEKNKEKVKIKRKDYYKANSEVIKIKQKKYNLANKDRILIRDRIANKVWYQKNKDKKYLKNKERLKTDIQYKIKLSLRTRLYHAVKLRQKSGSAINDLGCSLEFFIQYIESKFYNHPQSNEKMSWDNWGRAGWQLDHIIPLFKFDLTNQLEFKKAVNYLNIQPLWTIDHIQKSGRDRKK